nr:creatininase family protein [Nocardia bovistercoris]
MLPTTTSTEAEAQGARTAVLPIGSFEQHGEYHPLVTDTVIACVIAERIAQNYDLLLLPPITFSCSHEHAAFSGSVSIRATTLAAVVADIFDSLARSGVDRLAIVNGHGGNYVLQNVVQESNVDGRRMTLFPYKDDWDDARRAAGMVTSGHEDMHAGELETSILLHTKPELLRPGYETADWRADDRRLLLVKGLGEYTKSGVIGFPSLGTAEKGRRALESLSESFEAHLRALS